MLDRESPGKWKSVKRYRRRRVTLIFTTDKIRQLPFLGGFLLKRHSSLIIQLNWNTRSSPSLQTHRLSIQTIFLYVTDTQFNGQFSEWYAGRGESEKYQRICDLAR